MNRPLAVGLELGVGANAIYPTALATPMLDVAFAGRTNALCQLDKPDPAGQIGEPADVARLTPFLAHPRCPFRTGSCLTLNGA
jgi:acetoacetyl-CoA reductase